METKNDSIVLNDMAPISAVHPGSILKEELKARGIKQKDFAEDIGMKAPHLSALIHGGRSITSALAGKLEEGLGIPASLWLTLQKNYNLDRREIQPQHPSNVVAGYKHRRNAVAVVAEPDSPGYGARMTVRVSLASQDWNLLHLLAERMGWALSEI